MVKFKAVIRNQDDQETQDGTYNVKIRVTHNQKTRYIGTQFYIKPGQIDKTGEILDHPNATSYNIKLRNLKNLYDQKILDMGPKTSSMDIRALIKYIREIDPEGRDKDFHFYGERFVEKIRKKGSISYANSIQSTLNEIRKFAGDNLEFGEINPAWLEEYGEYQKLQNKTINTLAIHYRNIRVLYNDAIRNHIIKRDIYPFYDFQIKQEKTHKRSLNIDDIRRIRDVELKKENEMRARDLFMLSFYMNGINFKDLLLARKENIYQGRYMFNRAKTGRPYSVKIFPETQEIIDRYPGEIYLLNFMERKELVNIKKDRNIPLYKDITDQTNRLLKDVAEDAKVPVPLSTYYARHSLATIARNIGISRDDIRSILGHGENTVTDIYIDLDLERIDDAMRMILELLNQGDTF